MLCQFRKITLCNQDCLQVPSETMKRVKTWCQFTWNTQKSFDEREILQYLPGKMMTDVALNIHFKTISGVKLFHGCNPGLLKMLVCKLKPIIFLPGDYICKEIVWSDQPPYIFLHTDLTRNYASQWKLNGKCMDKVGCFATWSWLQPGKSSLDCQLEIIITRIFVPLN